MIRVLAIDDSALMRRLLREIFEAEEGFEIAFARDGVEGVEMVLASRPDVVTLDIHMPNMDGLKCLDRIMLERPCPVVMFSSLTDLGARETLEALELGAVDFVLKPTGAVSLKVGSFGPALIEKVRIAAKSRPMQSRRLAERVRLRTGGIERRPTPALRAAATPRPAGPLPASGEGLVLVGSSTGRLTSTTPIAQFRSRRAARAPVKLAGMCWAITIGQGKSAGRSS